ncbi:MAG TPA: formylglycine-generating enzyme family protein, partial [Chloroflexi bacterium]|nr:formylglycine-generating enzyme family protein [Chloroflexota bacterium]
MANRATTTGIRSEGPGRGQPDSRQYTTLHSREEKITMKARIKHRLSSSGFRGLGLVATIFVTILLIFTRAVVSKPVVNVSEEVFVPEGMFLMGCAYDLFGGCDSDTRPVHGVYLDAFYINRTEVTNAQYRACVQAGACTPPRSDASNKREDYYTNARYNNYPVINVVWHQAHAYCQWVGRRLPTEAEWEKAARGTDLRKYPWGNDAPSCARVNYNLCRGDTAAVGSYPDNVSPYGALDMAGNVSEWVNDVYSRYYYKDSPYYNPKGPGGTGEHLVRGGSWAEDQGGITTFI